jgi:hypothetical protein
VAVLDRADYWRVTGCGRLSLHRRKGSIVSLR